jgi:hypothetical protein
MHPTGEHVEAVAETHHHEAVTVGHEEHAHAHDPIIAEGSAIMGRAGESVFHVFHPIHMFFSAVATTAMFWRYERRLFKAILIGIIGSIGVCGISDVFIPYGGALLLGVKGIAFHWCLIQHPMLVIPFTAVGVTIGLLAAETVHACTYYSHSAHVFVSSAASLFYLVSFGMTMWAEQLGAVFVLLIIAVTLPCCFSDIVFPLLFIRGEGHPVPCCDLPRRHSHEEVDEAVHEDHHHH